MKFHIAFKDTAYENLTLPMQNLTLPMKIWQFMATATMKFSFAMK